MIYQHILYSVSDGVATLMLNRPEQLNAWTNTMEEEVRTAMHAASADESVKVIVLTGAGRGFCAGADMKTLSNIQGSGAIQETPRRRDDEPLGKGDPNFGKTYSYFPAVPKPIIAAINGPVVGLGLVVALYCDMRFASDNAVFSTTFARRGLIAEHGISWLLPRLIGMGKASDLLFSARKVGAAEACEMGLVDRVISHEDFLQEVTQYARMLAGETSPRSHRVMKRQLWNAQFQTLGEAIDVADADMLESFVSEDFQEGVTHFAEKRAPAFSGR
jgi:enoyl-CoA hydratase/carnithine racemase